MLLFVSQMQISILLSDTHQSIHLEFPIIQAKSDDIESQAEVYANKIMALAQQVSVEIAEEPDGALGIHVNPQFEKGDEDAYTAYGGLAISYAIFNALGDIESWEDEEKGGRWRFHLKNPSTDIPLNHNVGFFYKSLNAIFPSAHAQFYKRDIIIEVNPEDERFDRLSSGFTQYFEQAYGSNKNIFLSVMRNVFFAGVGYHWTDLVAGLSKAIGKKFASVFLIGYIGIQLTMKGAEWKKLYDNGELEKLGAEMAMFFEAALSFGLGTLSRSAFRARIGGSGGIIQTQKGGGGSSGGPSGSGGGPTQPRGPSGGGKTAVMTRTTTKTYPSTSPKSNTYVTPSGNIVTYSGAPKIINAIPVLASSSDEVVREDATIEIQISEPPIQTLPVIESKIDFYLDAQPKPKPIQPNQWKLSSAFLQGSRGIGTIPGNNGAIIHIYPASRGAVEEWRAYRRIESQTTPGYIDVPQVELWMTQAHEADQPTGEWYLVAVQQMRGQKNERGLEGLRAIAPDGDKERYVETLKAWDLLNGRTILRESADYSEVYIDRRQNGGVPVVYVTRNSNAVAPRPITTAAYPPSKPLTFEHVDRLTKTGWNIKTLKEVSLLTESHIFAEQNAAKRAARQYILTQSTPIAPKLPLSQDMPQELEEYLRSFEGSRTFSHWDLESCLSAIKSGGGVSIACWNILKHADAWCAKLNGPRSEICAELAALLGRLSEQGLVSRDLEDEKDYLRDNDIWSYRTERGGYGFVSVENNLPLGEMGRTDRPISYYQPVLSRENVSSVVPIPQLPAALHLYDMRILTNGATTDQTGFISLDIEWETLSPENKAIAHEKREKFNWLDLHLKAGDESSSSTLTVYLRDQDFIGGIANAPIYQIQYLLYQRIQSIGFKKQKWQIEVWTEAQLSSAGVKRGKYETEANFQRRLKFEYQNHPRLVDGQYYFEARHALRVQEALDSGEPNAYIKFYNKKE